MVMYNTIIKNARAKVYKKAGPAFYDQEAGYKDNINNKLITAGVGTRLFIRKEWILSTYRIIGVRAAIFIYIYAYGNLYGQDFPGAKAVRQYRENTQASNID